MKIYLPYTFSGEYAGRCLAAEIKEGQPLVAQGEELPPGMYVVLGTSGSGKSVLTRQLAAQSESACLSFYEPEEHPIVAAQHAALMEGKIDAVERIQEMFPTTFDNSAIDETRKSMKAGFIYPASVFGESDESAMVALDLANVGVGGPAWPGSLVARLRAIAVAHLLALMAETTGPVFLDSLRVPLLALDRSAAGERGTDPMYMAMLATWSPIIQAVGRTVVVTVNPGYVEDRFVANVRAQLEGTMTGLFYVSDQRVDLTYRQTVGQGRRQMGWGLGDAIAHPTPIQMAINLRERM